MSAVREVVDPGPIPEPEARTSAGERLAVLAAVAGLLEALLLAVSATGLLLISGLAGGLGSDTVPSTGPTHDTDRHELWVSAGFSLAAMLLILAGAALTLSWRASRRRSAKILLTWALAILIVGSFLQAQIKDLSVSRWWTGALVGLAVATMGLTWLSGRYWPADKDAEGPAPIDERRVPESIRRPSAT